ncbi:MAG: LamG-like jellyroll fold domain-containing protein [Pontiella sp.]
MKEKKRVVMAFVAGILCISISQAALVAEWNFDDQTLTNSGSISGEHEGSFVSGPTTNPVVGTAVFSTNTPSGSGYALDLSSITNYMMISNSSSNYDNYVDTFDSATNFTYSMWIMNPSGTWNGYGSIASKGFEAWNQDDALKVGFELRAQNFTDAVNGVRVEFWGNSSVQDPTPYTDLTDGNWHLLTYTYDSMDHELDLYVDGILRVTGSNATMTAASGNLLIFDAVEGDENAKQANCMYDSIQFYDHALSESEVANLYIQQTAFTVDLDELTMELIAPATVATGTVEVAYLAATNVEVNVFFSNETHLGAFSVLEEMPLVLTNVSPVTTSINIEFNMENYGGMTNGEMASCTAIIVWNVQGDTEVTEVEVPVRLLYEIPPTNIVVSVQELGTTPAAVNPLNLSTLGPVDWVMLGQGGSTSNRNEKAGADYIGEVTVAGTHSAFGGNAYLSSWTNGAVQVSTTDVQGNWEAGGTGGSLFFSLTGLMPAKYTMKVYCSKYKATAQLTVFKGSDSFSVPFDQGGTVRSYYGVFSIDFSIESNDESLDVIYELVAISGPGNVGITAITLERTGYLPPIVGEIYVPTIVGGTNLILRFETTPGYQYAVEATDDLIHGTWSNIAIDISGDEGNVVIMNVISEDDSQRFYRAYLQE